MKPDWKDAPEWANWLAMDEDGVWFWYENEPLSYHEDNEWHGGGGKYTAAGTSWWRKTKEKDHDTKGKSIRVPKK